LTIPANSRYKNIVVRGLLICLYLTIAKTIGIITDAGTITPMYKYARDCM
jgi:hypothetical protein